MSKLLEVAAQLPISRQSLASTRRGATRGSPSRKPVTALASADNASAQRESAPRCHRLTEIPRVDQEVAAKLLAPPRPSNELFSSDLVLLDQ
jgi:hypothetical protein